jgi:hypothetical protein
MSLIEPFQAVINLVVVDQFNVKGVSSFKTEDHAPVGAYRQIRPYPAPIATFIEAF